MEKIESNKIDKYIVKRVKNNAAAFLLTSSLFLIYWSLFLLFNLNIQSNTFNLYLFFIILELSSNIAIIVTSIISLLKRNYKRYQYFFTCNWILLIIATFPIPFAYLFNAGINNTFFYNEVAAIATPTTVLCILSLFFAAASIEKYHQEDEPAHKTFSRLMVGTLFTAVLYVFSSLIYKIISIGQINSRLTSIFYYIVLLFIYFLLCLYSAINVTKEMLITPTKINKKTKAETNPLFIKTYYIYLFYALVSIAIDIINFTFYYINNNEIYTILYGKLTSTSVTFDFVILLFIHLFIFIFSLIKILNKKSKKDSLYSLSLLLILLCLSFFFPSMIGGYEIVKTYISNHYNLTNYIIPLFGIISLSAIGVGSAIAAIFFIKDRRIDAAIFIAVASFMIFGVDLFLYGGEIYLLLYGYKNTLIDIISLSKSVFDLIIIAFNLLTLVKEYPKAKD